MSAGPGWYRAEGDPEGMVRYWDGDTWVGDPRPARELARPETRIHGWVVGDAGRRVAAALIDSLVVSLSAIPVLVAMLRTVDWEAVSAGQMPTFTGFVPDTRWIVAGWLFGAVYTIVPVALWGSTLGKWLMGLTIIRRGDGTTPPGWEVAALRYLPVVVAASAATVGGLAGPELGSLGSTLEAAIVVASFVLVLSDRTRRSVYDLVARTNVVRRGVGVNRPLPGRTSPRRSPR